MISFKWPLRNAFLTLSLWISHHLVIAILKTIRIVASLTTGLKVSSQSMPSLWDFPSPTRRSRFIRRGGWWAIFSRPKERGRNDWPDVSSPIEIGLGVLMFCGVLNKIKGRISSRKSYSWGVDLGVWEYRKCFSSKRTWGEIIILWDESS